VKAFSPDYQRPFFILWADVAFVAWPFSIAGITTIIVGICVALLRRLLKCGSSCDFFLGATIMRTVFFPMCIIVFGAGRTADAVTIDANAQIDEHFVTKPGDIEINIVDGASPPTVVDVLDQARIDAWVNVRGQSQLNIFGGSFGSGVQAFDNSNIVIWDGLIAQGEDLEAHDNSTIIIRGGTIGTGSDQLIASHNANISIYGGEIRKLPWALENGIIDFYGRGLALLPVMGSDDDFTLTGELADGTAIEVAVLVQGNGLIRLHEVPEPSGIWLLCIGAATLVNRLRRN
jgi:hypothetical protein